VTPNQVTAVSLGLGLTAVVLAAVGGWPAVGGAGLLMFAQVVLDSVDGELSRVRHLGSKLGMWLDNLSDDVLDNLLVVGLGAGLGGPWLALGVAAAVGRGGSAIVTYLGAAAAGSPGDVMAFRWWFEDPEASADQAFNAPSAGVTSVRALGRRDTYMLIYAAGCCLGLPGIAFALGVINGAVYTVMAIAHLAARRGRP
jgi:phosphatidylglycerophosphate synthase